MAYDVYCVFCAAAFSTVHAEDEPRSKEFRRAIQVPGCNAHDDDCNIPHSEIYRYDRDLVNPETTKWLKNAYVIWIDPNTKVASLRGPFETWGYGFFEDPDGGDTPLNLPQGFNAIRGYHFAECANQDENDYADQIAAAPFHLSCWRIFATVKRKRPGSLNYGNPGPEHDQSFKAYAGEEFLVYDPDLRPVQAAKNLIRTRLQSSTFDLDRVAPSRSLAASSATQKCVPATASGNFGKLPYDIIYSIAALLPLKSAIALAGASRQLNAWLHSGAGLWKRTALTSMPWLVELHELMQEEPDLFTNKSTKRLLLWLDHATTGRPFLIGPFMSVANRRRVWTTCEQLDDIWLEVDDDSRRNEAHIRTISQNFQQETFASWVDSIWGTPIQHFWVKSWREISHGQKILETTWDSEGFLLGITVTINGNRRIAGGKPKLLSTNEGVIKQDVEIGYGEWISGFVIYLPPFDLTAALDRKKKRSSPRGIELILTSGKHVMIGDGPSTSWKRGY